MHFEQTIPPHLLLILQQFVALLDKWRKVTDLVSPAGFEEIWQRHVFDCVYLQRLLPDKLHWVDFGTGAGFPGVVVAIMLSDRKESEVHCIESDGRKCSFLRTVARELKIPIKVHNARAENIGIATTGLPDVVTTRAFSSVEDVIKLSEEYLARGAILILPRGKTFSREVEAIDPNQYTTIIHANPEPESGVYLQIQLRA